MYPTFNTCSTASWPVHIKNGPWEPCFYIHAEHVILQDKDGVPVYFPQMLIPYASWLQHQVASGRGYSLENPIPVQCEYMTLINIIVDLEGLIQGNDIPVEEYDGPTLRTLAHCAGSLGINRLVQTYEKAVREQTAVQVEPQQLFAELHRLFPNNTHLIINLYLVIMGARRGTYIQHTLTPEEIQGLDYLYQHYGIYVTSHTNGVTTMITKEPIDPNRLKNDVYIAYLLNYGCLDPSYIQVREPRVAYSYESYVQGIHYHIMSFVCTVPYRVSAPHLEEIRSRFEQAIQLLDPQARVVYREREVSPSTFMSSY